MTDQQVARINGRFAARPVAERFWEKVAKTDTCWLWTAGCDSTGYGTFRFNGGMVGAHRVAYELVVGPIPPGLTIDHLCRVKLCMNPAHMEPVTLQENVARAPRVLRTHCTHGHEFTPENTYRHPSTPRRRECRICRVRRGAARQALKAEAAS